MKNPPTSYIVVTVKPWNIAEFKKRISKYPGTWHLVTDPRKLASSLVRKIQPRYIFFPHWSWRVPKNILESAECICFHETNVPYGRGGSPIQNLIVRGHTRSSISALRMEKGLDTGPVYLKRPISLSGTAKEIYERNARVVAQMIHKIITRDIVPKPQRGKAITFRRRTPAQSDVRALERITPRALYNHIRMLDAPTYPPAYCDVGPMRLEFSDARLEGTTVKARVRIRKRKTT